MAVERTLVLIKPDAMQRGLAGEILGRLERRGLALRDAKLVQVDRGLAEEHYAEHAEKPFYGELVEFITSGATLALVLEGEGAIAVTRTTMGATNPADAATGSIRRAGLSRSTQLLIALGFSWRSFFNTAAKVRPVSRISSTSSTSRPRTSKRNSLVTTSSPDSVPAP